MAFVDEARIFLKAGDGGKGCESFYRDRLTRYARPDGGDGGKGGDIVFVADRGLQTLLDYRFKQHYEGGRGGHGSSKGKKGRSGTKCVLRVPVGTIIRDYESKMLIRDLVENGQELTVARGGAAGRGNINHRTPAPPGKGEEKTIHLELKIIADVGLIGFPNAGKSSLICQVANVHSKIACYPFTTRQPVLGVVKGDEFDFTIADLPGLIEGAHSGRGLGDRFLKHAERTKILIHCLDMAASEGRDPGEDFEKIVHELESYSDKLGIKERLVVANKMDLPGSDKHLKDFVRRFKGKVYPVSALTGEGLEELMDVVRHLLESIQKADATIDTRITDEKPSGN